MIKIDFCWNPSVGRVCHQWLSQQRSTKTAVFDHRAVRQGIAPSLGAISRKLRLLRDHGLIQKIQKSYRYKVTSKGRPILTALIAASNAPVNTFIPKAA
jgi:hypothetical protein